MHDNYGFCPVNQQEITWYPENNLVFCDKNLIS